MAVNEASWDGLQVIYRFTSIRKWVLRLWKRPFWLSKKMKVTFSLHWSLPCQGGCSQVLTSSKRFDSSIFDWFPILPGYDTHELGGCHLRCWRYFFSEYCIRPWIVFYNITAENNSTFIFLVLCIAFSIFHPSVMQNEIFRPSFLLHRSPVSYFWL